MFEIIIKQADYSFTTNWAYCGWRLPMLVGWCSSNLDCSELRARCLLAISITCQIYQMYFVFVIDGARGIILLLNSPTRSFCCARPSDSIHFRSPTFLFRFKQTNLTTKRLYLHRLVHSILCIIH